MSDDRRDDGMAWDSKTMMSVVSNIFSAGIFIAVSVIIPYFFARYAAHQQYLHDAAIVNGDVITSATTASNIAATLTDKSNHYAFHAVWFYVAIVAGIIVLGFAVSYFYGTPMVEAKVLGVSIAPLPLAGGGSEEGHHSPRKHSRKGW